MTRAERVPRGGRLPHRPGSPGTRAVVIGLSEYTPRWGRIPSARASARFYHQLLMDPDCWQLPPEHCLLLLDDSRQPLTSAAVIAAVRQAAREATDTLVVVYCGHAGKDQYGKLNFILPGEDQEDIRTDGLRVDQVAGAMAPDKALGDPRRVMVLDCCFSGAAAEVLNVISRTRQVEGGRHEHAGRQPPVFLACATHGDMVASAGTPAGYTGFTEAVSEVVAAFRRSDTGRRLTLGALFAEVGDRLRQVPMQAVPVVFQEGSAEGIPLLERTGGGFPPPALPAGCRSLLAEIAECAIAGIGGRATPEHGTLCLRIEPAPQHGANLVTAPHSLPREEAVAVSSFALLRVLPPETDVPLCLLARAAALSAAGRERVQGFLEELARFCAVLETPAREGRLPAFVLSMTPQTRDLLAAAGGTATEKVGARARTGVAELHNDLVAAARTLLPPPARGHHPLPGLHSAHPWSQLPPARSSCGERYIWRHLVGHLVDAGRTAEAATLATASEWIMAKLFALGSPGPVVADLQRSCPGEPVAATVGRFAHLLRPADGRTVVDAVLAGRLGRPVQEEASCQLLLTDHDDAEPASVRRVLLGHAPGGDVRSMDVVAGRLLTVGGNDGTVRLWDTGTGEELGCARGTRPFLDCALLGTSGYAITVREDGTVHLWDTGDLREPLSVAEDVSGAGVSECLALGESTVLCKDRSGLSILDLHEDGSRVPRLRRSAHLAHLGPVPVVVAAHRTAEEQSGVEQAEQEEWAVLAVTHRGFSHRWSLRKVGGDGLRPFSLVWRNKLRNGEGVVSTRVKAGGAAKTVQTGTFRVVVLGQFPAQVVLFTWRPASRDLTELRLDGDPVSWPTLTPGAHGTAAAFSSDGHLLALVDGSGRVAITGADGSTQVLPAQGPVRNVAFTGAGELLAFGGDGRLQVWAPAVGAKRRPASPVGVWREGAGIVVPREDGSVTRHRLRDGVERAEPWETGPTASQAGGAKVLVAAHAETAASRSGSLVVLGLASGRMLLLGDGAPRGLADLGAAVTAVALSPGGEQLVAASASGWVDVWQSLAPDEPATRLGRLPDRPEHADMHWRGEHAFLTSGDQIHHVLLPAHPTEPRFGPPADLGTQDDVPQRASGRPAVTALCCDNTEQLRIFAAARGRLFKILFTSRPRTMAQVTCAGEAGLTALAVSPDSLLLASADSDGLVTVRRTDDLQVVARHRLNAGLNGLVWLPDGLLVVSGHTGLAVLRLRQATPDRAPAHPSCP